MAVLELELSRVKFLGTPCEMLYKSPLIFIKVKCYYAFNGEVRPTCKESTCPSDDSLSSSHPPPWGRGLRLFLPFFYVKLPLHPPPISSGAGPGRLLSEEEPEELLVFLLL